MDQLTLSKRLRYLSFDQASTPTDHSLPIVNHYWLVHPDKGLVFYQSDRYAIAPQANSNLLITNKINNKMYANFEFEVRLINVAYVPLKLNGTFDVPNK